MSTRFLKLEETPLRLTRAEVMESVSPYIARECAKDDPFWKNSVRTTSVQIARRAAKRIVKGGSSSFKRDVQKVEKSYSEGWPRIDWARYAVTAPRPSKGSPWLWDDKFMVASNVLGARMRLWYLMRAIEHLKPRSVLEVGSGPGINLVTLACRFPEISFQGLELSGGGVATAREVQNHTELPEALQSFSPEMPVDLGAHRRVIFTQGNAAKMPFQDAQFDLVYSSLALEQMEPIRDAALKEFARVTGKFAVMLEPFRDANLTLLRRGYVWGHEYFRGTINELSNYKLKPEWATLDMPQKLWLGAALAVSSKV